MLRKGQSNNVMINLDLEYGSSTFSSSSGQYTFTHNALGADSLRYSWNFGQKLDELDFLGGHNDHHRKPIR